MPSVSALSLYSALGQRLGGTSSTLMVDAAPAHPGLGGGNQHGLSPEVLAKAIIAQAKAGLEAVLLSLPRDGKVTLALAGQKLAVTLPPEIQAEFAQNPAILRVGTHIPVEVEGEGQNLRFLWPQLGSHASTPQRATLVNLSPAARATQSEFVPTSPASQNAHEAASYQGGANRFPPGSIAHTIARLSGFSFPLLEASFVQQAGLAIEAHAEPLLAARLTASQAAFRSAVSPAALSAMPEGLAQAAMRAALAQSGIGQAISSLLKDQAQFDAPKAPLLAQLAGLRLDAKTKLDGTKIRDAMRSSGIFMEADLAQAALAAQEGQQPIALDLKALLFNLKAAMQENPATEAQVAQKQPSQQAPPAGLPQEEHASTLRLITGAIERIKLMQMASIPDHSDIIHTDEAAQPLRLALALPLAIEGKANPATVMLGVVVEHHPQPVDIPIHDERPEHQTEAEKPYPWTIRLALETEESGAVQAEIGLRGMAIRVDLWMERERVADTAREQINTLYSALKEADFDQVSLSIKNGAPVLAPSALHHPKLDQYT